MEGTGVSSTSKKDYTLNQGVNNEVLPFVTTWTD
jgi:hypothetical protein